MCSNFRMARISWILAGWLLFLAPSCTFDTSGPKAPSQNNYSPCQDDSDCESLNCENDSDYCVPPGCDDGRLNGDESGPDCGGSCAPCPNGLTCRIQEDCVGLFCLEGFCQAEHCANGRLDEGESGPDCGQDCAPCETGEICLGPSDCQSLVCDLGVCLEATCGDSLRNGNEIDVDCGGDCPPCPEGSRCLGDQDCANERCNDDFCQPDACTNGKLDGDETDLDCGGGCVGCELFGACLDTTDCRSSLVCFDDACRISALVSFDAQGGLAPNPVSRMVILGEAYGELATTSRTGHTFDGWWTGPGRTETQVTAATVVTRADDHTLFAKWTADTSTVTFDAQGGTALTPGSKTVTFGEPYGELATTNRAGYTFDGWWTGPGGTGSRVFATSVVSIAGDHTLFAKWLPNTYTVTFDSQGGSSPVPESQLVIFGVAYGTLATTSRTGYTFAGWWTGAGGTGSQVTAATIVTNAANHTLYARWTANTITVTFNANGGSAPNPATRSVSFAAAYGALATTSRTGYTFAGWWTGAGGTGAQVTAATIVT
ncbi:InlB B-repeat-containing protein, partial [Myxococcota bacterium]|nr:InlB B-repeat-containing protein [Myxococcota bacterium]